MKLAIQVVLVIARYQIASAIKGDLRVVHQETVVVAAAAAVASWTLLDISHGSDQVDAFVFR